MSKKLFLEMNKKIFSFLYYYFSPSAVRLPLSTVHILPFYTVLNEDPDHYLYGSLSSL